MVERYSCKSHTNICNRKSNCIFITFLVTINALCARRRLDIDNNLVENAIRPIAIGRKNYLFDGSHKAAQTAVMFYSLLGTCKLNNVEPFQRLKNLFEILPDNKANMME